MPKYPHFYSQNLWWSVLFVNLYKLESIFIQSNTNLGITLGYFVHVSYINNTLILNMGDLGGPEPISWRALILKIEGNTQHFGILCFIISRKVTMQLKHKKYSCSVWRRCCDRSNVSKVVCKVSCWRFLAGRCSTVG